MSEIVYRISGLLTQVLHDVPVGTNPGLLPLQVALLSGPFLAARGAVFPALNALGLAADASHRASAALCYGRWKTANLFTRWQQTVTKEGRFKPNPYEGIRPVACDLTAFFRPQLRGITSKHYVSEASKALPALVFGRCVAVGQVGAARLGLPRLVLRRREDENEAALQKRLLTEAAKTRAADETLGGDAGFGLADLLALKKARFVARVRRNQSARRDTLPAYGGKGRRPEKGDLVRPLPRKHASKEIAATEPDKTRRWKDGERRLRAQEWRGLVLPDQKPGAAAFRIVAIFDPRYKEPLLLATDLTISAEALWRLYAEALWRLYAEALWRLYRDRWAVEQLPLAAKPLLGAERSFVFGKDSRYRLPEFALLAGNLLSYLAATSAPVATGFWDRAARPTRGRLRRALSRAHFAEFACAEGQLRKKNSVTAHLATGRAAHRRTKGAQSSSLTAIAA